MVALRRRGYSDVAPNSSTVRQQKSLDVTPVGERVCSWGDHACEAAGANGGIFAGIPLDAEGRSASDIGEQGIVEPGKGSLGNDVKQVLAGYSGLHCAQPDSVGYELISAQFSLWPPSHSRQSAHRCTTARTLRRAKLLGPSLAPSFARL